MAKEKGTVIGTRNVEKLRAYVAGVEKLPALNGKAYITAISEACGVDRQALYKNPECRRLLEEAIEEKGLVGIEKQLETDREKVVLERRITQLEQTNASFLGEVYELRRELKKYQYLEEMIEQGKRVIL